MVFEPNYKKVVSSVRKNLGITQSVVELRLPTSDSQIAKIYSIGAKPSITSASAIGSEVNFFGIVDFQAVFEGEEIVALDYSAEFKDNFLVDKEVVGELLLTSNVIDINSSIVSGGIKVVAIIETCIDVIVSQDLNVLVGAEGDDVHLVTKDLRYSTYIGKAAEKIDITGSISLDNATSVLMVTPCMSVYEIIARENYLIVSGKLNLDICYKNGESKESISTHNHFIEFSKEVALEGLTPESIVQSCLSVLYNEIKISTILEDGGACVDVNVPVVYSGYVFEENTIEIVEDLYVESNYMSVTCENFETIKGEGSICFKDNISGIAAVSETAPFIDEILGVTTNNLMLASCRLDNDRMYVEGVVNSTVVYFTKETSEVTSVQVEMPFVVEGKVKGEKTSVVTICLDNIFAKSKRGKEIEVSAELCVYADMFSEGTVCVITGVTLGEEKAVDDCSLYIYIVKPNETLWDVAKNMNTSQELIMEQNPDVELPLKAGDRLVIYRPNTYKYE